MLTIAEFQANYYLPQGVPGRASEQARLDRIARQRLLEEMAEVLAPSPDDEGAVYRIRNLRVDLWVDTLGMSDGEIARRWGRTLVQAIVRALLRAPPSQMVRYEDHAHFVAAFLGDLMVGRAWSRWVYEEFVPLQGLPVGQIAAQLLAPRPALLLSVAQRLARERRLEPLLQRLEAADVRLIWERGLGFDTLPDAPVRGAMLDRILNALGSGIASGAGGRLALELRGGLALERGSSVAAARNALRIYLQVVIAQPGLAKVAALGAVSRHLALVHQVWAARPSPWLWGALARDEIASPAALAPLLEGLGQERATVRDWLKVTLAQPSGRAYLARLVSLVVPIGAATTADEGREPAAAVLAHQVATRFAGLALLLPAIRDLGLHKYLSREGLYQVLLSAVRRRYQPLAWSDAAPGWLAGIPPQELEGAREARVEWPDSTLWGERVGPDRAREVAGLAGSSPGDAFALLALAWFARGLRGFADSSPAYLAEQFINLPGHLLIDRETIEAHLSRAPLGIVLHMAGLDGDRGPIPWLEGRHLWIHLP